MKDYGEPWVVIKNESISPSFRTLKDRNGACPQEAMERSVSCVNALSGIPDAWLKDAKKAIVAWKLVEWTKEIDIYEPFQNMQEPIDIALDFRKHGDNFGPELNQLIDSFKE